MGFSACLNYTFAKDGGFMKKFFIITGYCILTLLTCLYLGFWLVLPHVIDLNTYKPEIQKLVKDNTDLTFDFKKADLVTSPFLEAGVKLKDISVKLPDNSEIFHADSIKGKVFLPALLGLSIRVSCAEIESPELNVEIINSEKYKIAKVYEDFVNDNRVQRRLNPPQTVENTTNSFPIDPASIKFFVPALKLHNYQAVIDDVKAGHKLTLKGDQLKVGYFNGKIAKLKTKAELLSDNNTNITADVDINTFIPKFETSKQEENDEEVFALPFVNPVSVYRDYNLKSNINTKLKIRQSRNDNKIWMKGFLNVDNTTVTLSNLQLPESHFKLKSKGYIHDFDTNLYVTDEEYIKFSGKVNYGKKPYFDVALKSSKVHFDNLLKITRAYLDTIQVKNDIAQMSANGYFLSNFSIKTNFENIISDGNFVVRGGNINDRNIGLIFDNINANLLFNDNVFNIKDTHLLINKKPVNISGKIDSNSIADVNINADKIPLPALYLAFAPAATKKAYDLKAGLLSLEVKVAGEIKDISVLCRTELHNLLLSDRGGNFNVSNELTRLGYINSSGTVRGKFKNKGFRLTLPAMKSVISDEIIAADIDNKTITVYDSNIKINKNSVITFRGKVNNYVSNPAVRFVANGNLKDSDLKILAGDAISPYLDSRGCIPLKANFESKKDKMKAVVQLKTDSNSYITPVKIDQLVGKQLLVQLLAEKSGESVKIYKSGLYVRKPNAQFRDNLASNLINSHEIIGVRAMISNLSTTPFINLLKVTFPKELNGSICVLPKSRFSFGGHLYAFGKLYEPKISGDFNIRNLRIPELMTTVRDINVNLGSRDVKVSLKDILANGSDFNINILTNWKLLSQMKLADVRVFSRSLDVDKLMKISEALTKVLPSSSTSESSQPADIPVEILKGGINLRRIKTGNIIVKNTTGRISLFNNIFYINNLRTLPMGGNVNGDVSVNLVTTELNARLSGRNFDIDKILRDAMSMKDTLSGDLNFLADISMKGATQEEQMKSLSGYVDFSVREGQLGPFGKFENFLMAENIRENAFFSSTIGAVITNIVTIDTSHFNTLYGHMTFDKGFADISPIKSQGDVMSMHIVGKVGLVDNSADLKLRGKLGSAFSDNLGPLANINPVNLVKNTPGVNAVAAKTFSVFCESVSEEEMRALPALREGKSDDYATKFQIVLRGDTRKPLKMIKSFKWLALDSEIQSAQSFVDTIPLPQAGEEDLSVEELINLRTQQKQAVSSETEIVQTQEPLEEPKKSLVDKIKNKLKKDEDKI